MALIGNINQIEKFMHFPNADKIMAYLKEALDKNSSVWNRIKSLPVGSFEKLYLTDEIFAIEQVFYTKDREECFFETHKNYIDFQLILEGIEQMEHCYSAKLQVRTEYNSEKDLIIYHTTDMSSKFVMERGDLAIYDIEDAHMGLGKFNEPCLVYKTVVKLPVRMFNA
jgi:biofilm protein TabA